MEQYEHRKEAQEKTTEKSQFDSQAFFRSHLVKSEEGQLEIVGEDLGPMELALLETEKRRRGSQAAQSREKVRADKAELENTKVQKNIRDVVPKDEVDPALKYTDPDKYIELKLAERADDPYQEVFDTASSEAAQEVGQMTVDGLITEHNTNFPDKQISLDMLEMDLPPRLMAEFTEGKLAPSEFLRQAADILYRPTEIANQELPTTPDLGAVGGQTTPTDDGSNDKLTANYASAIF